MTNDPENRLSRRRFVGLGGGIGLLPAATGPSTGTLEPSDPNIVRLSLLGARARGLSDETVIVQRAIDLAIASARPLFIDVPTRVSMLRVRSANGLVVYQTAPILGLRGGSFPALLSIEDSSDISWTGRLWLSCQWNSGYEAAIRFASSAGAITSNICIQDWAITGARTALRFGASDDQNGAISEISILGGFAYGCPNVVEAYGTETVLSFSGANLVANHLGGDVAWCRITSDAVRVIGAHLSIAGGEVQHNASAAGSAFLMEPCPVRGQSARYGTIIAIGVAIEAAGPLLTAADLPGASIARDSGHFFAEGCHGYHSQRDVPFVALGKQYGGRMKIGGGCYFRAGTQRTAPIIQCEGSARLDVASEAFNSLFHPLAVRQ